MNDFLRTLLPQFLIKLKKSCDVSVAVFDSHASILQ